MLECIPLAVGHETEGISLMVRMGPHWILLDCGLPSVTPQWRENYPIPIAAICSHAHTDHSRGLIALQELFPQLPIYCSALTQKLLPATINCLPLEWRVPQEICPHLWLTLFPAGHLPGAACTWLTYSEDDREYSICYTGDFCLGNGRFVEGMALQELRGLMPDVLIIEGSYGALRLPHRRHQENQLLHRIRQILAEGRSVFLPLPPLGLSQEILMLLRSHFLFSGMEIDIWVDEQIALGCDQYVTLLPELPRSVQNFAQHQALFWDNHIWPRAHRLRKNQTAAIPSIFLLDDQSPYDRIDTKGIILLPELHHKPEALPYETYFFSEHADVTGTTQLIHTLRPQHVVFVHGAPQQLAELATLETLCNRYHVHCPSAKLSLALPVFKEQSIVVEPALLYTGELSELESTVMLTLSEKITTDSRWMQFADTGLIEARWQGNELVIRGISQREWLNTQTTD